MGGSTSTQPLAVLIACHNFGVGYSWAGEKQHWLYRSDPRWRRIERDFELFEFTLQAQPASSVDERLAIIINRILAANASTHDAYEALNEGKTDIALIARLPSQTEADLAKSKHIEFDIAPFALDAKVQGVMQPLAS